MSLYHEAAEILSAPPDEGGSLKSRVFRRKNLKSTPNQLYALVFETCKWSAVLKEVVEKSDLLKHERKVFGSVLFSLRWLNADDARQSLHRYCHYCWHMTCFSPREGLLYPRAMG